MKSSYVIIEDEADAMERLSILVQKRHGHVLEPIGSASTFDEALALLDKNRPDLVFMDIQLGAVTSFELLKVLPHHDFHIIFTTAHQEYALNAIKLSALDYLLKPISHEDLDIAVQKHLQSRIQMQHLNKLEVLLGHFEQGRPKKITVPTLNGYEFIEISNIVRCQSDGNYTHIYLKSNQKLTVAKTLKEFEQLLDPHNFFRIHNSHLVNLDEIIRFNKGKGGFVELKDCSELEVSVRRKDELLKALKVKLS